MRFSILILILFGFASISYSETFVYLSHAGNDNNNGSISSPVLTLGKAIELANNIHSIRVTAGTFYTAQADLATSIYGGYNDSFTFQHDTLITVIQGTGGWGDPKPTIKVYNESNLTIDRLTVHASESSTKKPCAIYLLQCASSVVVKNCKLYGQQTSDNAQATYAIYIRDGYGEIKY